MLVLYFGFLKKVFTVICRQSVTRLPLAVAVK